MDKVNEALARLSCALYCVCVRPCLWCLRECMQLPVQFTDQTKDERWKLRWLGGIPLLHSEKLYGILKCEIVARAEKRCFPYPKRIYFIIHICTRHAAQPWIVEWFWCSIHSLVCHTHFRLAGPEKTASWSKSILLREWYVRASTQKPYYYPFWMSGKYRHTHTYSHLIDSL